MLTIYVICSVVTLTDVIITPVYVVHTQDGIITARHVKLYAVDCFLLFVVCYPIMRGYIGKVPCTYVTSTNKYNNHIILHIRIIQYKTYV